ncbi:hypothetical protein QJS04_geneDACA020122 [Acorus gramineus]|uniref:Uncharacterized protein n=1 Tax=Acorus gramineus TaxID=55184 RepID=A0AAV8ZX97_ACOGR|nr:hypothetical protein QJS04_geneDACA020122 [Acorus gramineus]
MMQVCSRARRPIASHCRRFLAPSIGEESLALPPPHRTFTSQAPPPLLPHSRILHGGAFSTLRLREGLPMCSPMVVSYFSSEATTCQDDGSPSEAVKELHQKMLKSVEAETMPPNAWMWSLLDSCANREDIKLLFDILQHLRRFRLSNLRIHSNFNPHLCLKVSEACACVGALDYGTKTLCKHNVYGLTPSIGSAHKLLLYAKEHNKAKLMVKIMKLLERNSLQVQSGTADIVFSICYNTNNWSLISKYSKKFIGAGVKLQRTSFDIWMECAAKIGDAQTVLKIEKLRSESIKFPSISSSFSIAKAYLLENKPENAAASIHICYQNLTEPKMSRFKDEFQNFMKWLPEVIKQQKEEDRKVLANSLVNDTAKMVSALMGKGLERAVDIEKLNEIAIPA